MVQAQDVAASLESGYGNLEGLKGIVQSVSEANASSVFPGSFTIPLLPIASELLTVNVTDATKFDGTLNLGSLVAGKTFVEVDAFLDTSDNIVAREVEAESEESRAAGLGAFIGTIAFLNRDSSGIDRGCCLILLRSARVRRAIWGLVFSAIFIFSAPLYGQYAGQEALSNFPADTQQISYTNLQELRGVPQYALIHEHLMSAPLRNLEALLRSAGVDPEKDVNELVLGWRGQVQDTTRFFGLAAGSFQPDQLHDFFVKSKLPIQRYNGYDLYAFGSGAARTDLFFTFLDTATAAFGRLGDLKVLLDVRNAERPALNSSDDFRRWEGNLEGLAPQWGIATGQAAANEAIPWLTQGKQIQIDPSALFGSVKAVLYRVNWTGSVMAHLSIVCQSDAAANGFGQLLTLLRNAQPSMKENVSPAVHSLLQNLQVQVEGSQVNLDASASVSDLTQLLNAPVTNSAH